MKAENVQILILVVCALGFVSGPLLACVKYPNAFIRWAVLMLAIALMSTSVVCGTIMALLR